MIRFEDIINNVKAITMQGLPFMEGRVKGDITEGKIYNIVDFGFLKGDEGDFAVYITRENPNEFYFGGSIVTENLKKIEETLTDEQLVELLDKGLEIVMTSKLSKNKRKYMNCTFFPSANN